ncbi:kinase [Thraustotheca clavata]|uniref:Kinase n=1 Tax=Thraustotheca clavata TaxID=74557 RepID=A0A1V9Z9N4_9STRA|nr:kinase [Thraustotheca clavata]
MPLQSFTVCVMSSTLLSSVLKAITIMIDALDSVNVSNSAYVVLIIGTSIGDIAILCAVAYFFIKKQKQDYNEGYRGVDSTGSEFAANFEALQLLRLDERLLKKLKSVARGAYGEIWKGEIVALKCLLPGKSCQDEILLLVDEIKLTNKLESPCIVKTLGAAWRIPSELQMVLEWMDRGDLTNVLKSTKPSITGGDSPNFPWTEKITTMLAIADGLTYLHAFDIIHRDLKSHNVLLDSMKETKLADFGVSREVTSETMTIGVGTYRWMAPEILQNNYYSTAADIYSFGMVIAELNMHHIPYSDKRNDQGHALVDTAIMSLVMQGAIKPTFTDSCPAWIRKLAEDCIEVKAEDRPSAISVAQIIRQHLKQA